MWIITFAWKKIASCSFINWLKICPGEFSPRSLQQNKSHNLKRFESNEL